jgi:amidase
MKKAQLLPVYFILLLFSCISNKKLKSNTAWENVSVEKIAESFQEKKVTAFELTTYFIKRIQKMDKAMDLNAVIIINPDALKIAKQLDKEIANGKYRGQLHGIPILIKDNIDTHDKMPNTAGSLLLKDNFPQEDAHIIKLLRESGAVLLGKTNLSEWANFRSEKSSSGWSSVGGQTRNFHDQTMTPCGSSAGSAVAAAAGFAPLTIGTETNGSIACPAAVNGVVGIKPTVGLWSRSGIIPISHTQDTAGPMAKTVKEAALILGPLAGLDVKDEKSQQAKRYIDYTVFCQPGALAGRRLGIDSALVNIEGELGTVMKKTTETLRKAGAEIIIVNYRKALSNTSAASYEILQFEFKYGVEKYLSGTNSKYKTLAQLVAANNEMKDKIMPIFGQEIFEKAVKRGSLLDSAYQKALKTSYQAVKNAIDQTISENKLDAIFGPSLGPAWPINYDKPSGSTGPSTYGHAARVGYPHITVPMGMVNNLPVALCLFGLPFTERELIGMAYDFERIRSSF